MADNWCVLSMEAGYGLATAHISACNLHHLYSSRQSRTYLWMFKYHLIRLKYLISKDSYSGDFRLRHLIFCLIPHCESCFPVWFTHLVTEIE